MLDRIKAFIKRFKCRITRCNEHQDLFLCNQNCKGIKEGFILSDGNLKKGICLNISYCQIKYPKNGKTN